MLEADVIGLARRMAILLLVLVTGGEAKMIERVVEYRDGETRLRGLLVADDAAGGRRPGVVVIHEYWGLNDYARQRACELAAMGYVALAADMYGDGKVAANPQEAGKLAGSVRGTPLMRSRAAAALATLRAEPSVDPNRLAAIGFCFGGTGVLELAYSGADLAGVVSFHGGLTAPTPEDQQRIKAKVLILHGAADPHVPQAQVTTALDALSKAAVDWQFIAYSGAVHAFTNPAAGSDPARGAAYHEAAAKRSWQHMQDFFAELFGNRPAG